MTFREILSLGFIDLSFDLVFRQDKVSTFHNCLDPIPEKYLDSEVRYIRPCITSKSEDGCAYKVYLRGTK